jgi:hypothetical protein
MRTRPVRTKDLSVCSHVCCSSTASVSFPASGTPACPNVYSCVASPFVGFPACTAVPACAASPVRGTPASTAASFAAPPATNLPACTAAAPAVGIPARTVVPPCAGCPAAGVSARAASPATGHPACISSPGSGNKSSTFCVFTVFPLRHSAGRTLLAGTTVVYRLRAPGFHLEVSKSEQRTPRAPSASARSRVARPSGSGKPEGQPPRDSRRKGRRQPRSPAHHGPPR